ncbi:hypothetical protein [Peterkaempfera griseoplana]|uniref:hypothetical protein n=1 Tax=Peterkaempfera griseoplana TaxID=66896 RepID=UPI000A93A7E6|nr:hypothetical protein [Peterkaempfera griseoplana]
MQIADGGGGYAVGAAAGVVGGSMAALVASVGAGAVRVEVENLKDFKSKVDRMLQDLEGSSASHSQISEQRLSHGHLGAGFGEATDLLAAYNNVHTNLETLSQTLAQQIEAMSITIDVSTKGYQNVEETRVAELWKIRDRTEAAQQPPQHFSGTKQGEF